jgi:hypothetical protein
MSFRLANQVFVESEIQRKRVSRIFRIKVEKFSVRYTGFSLPNCDLNASIGKDIEEILELDDNKILYLFRGKHNKESGIEIIVDAFSKMDSRYKLILLSNFVPSGALAPNIIHIARYLSNSELDHLFRKVDFSIGQLGDSPRITYSIPHKAFESAFYAVPYISKGSPALRELFKDSLGVKYIDFDEKPLEEQLVEAAFDPQFNNSGKHLKKSIERISSVTDNLNALLS